VLKLLIHNDNNIITEVNSLSIDDVKYTGNEALIQTIGEDIDSINF
jgi:phosphoglucomutase